MNESSPRVCVISQSKKSDAAPSRFDPILDPNSRGRPSLPDADATARDENLRRQTHE